MARDVSTFRARANSVKTRRDRDHLTLSQPGGWVPVERERIGPEPELSSPCCAVLELCQVTWLRWLPKVSGAA